MEAGTLQRQKAPRHEYAARALWMEQTAGSCEAVSTNSALKILGAHIPGRSLQVAGAILRYQSTPYSGSARGLRKAWQSVRSCGAVSTNPARRISSSYIRTTRLRLAGAVLRNQSTPYSGPTPGPGRAWQNVRSYEAASTNPALMILTGLMWAWQSVRSCKAVCTNPAGRLSSAHRKAWQRARSCEAVCTNPALRLSSAHSLPPRRLRQGASSGEQSAPRPEHAKRAIWCARHGRGTGGESPLGT